MGGEKMASVKVICAGCKRAIQLGPQHKKGQWLNCPYCGAGLQVISLDPPMLDWAEEGHNITDNAEWSKWRQQI
jgi:DNA-directed RNA polymerase subunit RPC12/RpoP